MMEDQLSRRIKHAHSRADNKQRTYNNTHGNLKENIVDINNYRQRTTKQKVVLLPKNLAQEAYIDALEDSNINIVFATGPAGTGKTMLAVLTAIKQLQQNEIQKIVITRPAISVDEQHGFLPGTLIEKMQPWVLPILDYFYEYYNKKEMLHMMEEGVIDVSPLAYMRGRTLKQSFILADEMQNATKSQMKMLLTRIGEGSKIIVTGDMAQHDRGYEENGLKDILDRMSVNNRIAVCHFDDRDVERHPVIETILKFYA
jgi:phosphate starvation-inducible PhoH-like protein